MKTIFLALALSATAAVAQSPEKTGKMAAADKVLVLGGDGSGAAECGVGGVYDERGLEYLAYAGCGG